MRFRNSAATTLRSSCVVFWPLTSGISVNPDAPELKDQATSTDYLTVEEFSGVPWLAAPSGLTDASFATAGASNEAKISISAQGRIKPLRSPLGAVRERSAGGKKKAHEPEECSRNTCPEALAGRQARALERWGQVLIMVLVLLAIALAVTRSLQRGALHGWHDAAAPPEPRHASGGCARTLPRAPTKEDVARGGAGGGGGGSWQMTAAGLDGEGGVELQRAPRTLQALVQVREQGWGRG